jgi:tetratricopeptide (TPR) repeat protein
MSNTTHNANASVGEPASAVPLRDHGALNEAVANSGPFDNVCSQVAAGHLLIAKNLIDAGQLPEAVDAIDQALMNSPRFAAAHFWKGVVLYLLARHDEAHQSLKSAADLDPSMANAWLALAYVQFEQALPEMALQSIDKSIAADPKNPRAHMLRATIMLSIGERGDAICSDQEAVQLSPGLGQARLRLAHSLLQAGDDAEAIEHIITALKMQSADVNTRLCLANLLLSLGHVEAAMDECRATAQLFPQSPHALVRLAEIYFDREDYPAAITAVEQARERVPKHIECEMILGNIYLRQGFPDRAIDHAKAALAIDKDLFEAQELLAEAEQECERSNSRPPS